MDPPELSAYAFSMRLALVSLEVVPGDRLENLRRIVRWMRLAADRGADLVMFPEAVLTGLVNRDDPDTDLPLGISLAAPEMRRIQEEAARLDLWVLLGILERKGSHLYDTAAVVSPADGVVFRYRRVTPGWRGPHADPRIYREGAVWQFWAAPWGTFGILICGDLFDDELIAAVRREAPDGLMVPMARSAPSGVELLSWWEEEQRAYAARVAETGSPAVLVNLREAMPGGAFGGALVVDQHGTIRTSLTPGERGILAVDFP